MRTDSSMPSKNRAGFVLPASSSREQLRPRTRAFALRVVALVESLPHTRTGNHFANQLLRCGTSVGANYRAACRARSGAEFCAKLGIVEEEADESIFWMEMIVDAQLVKKNRLVSLMSEANELLAMVVSSIRTARRRK
jgi:four helix bundle protein